jgi:hypothetical protein
MHPQRGVFPSRDPDPPDTLLLEPHNKPGLPTRWGPAGCPSVQMGQLVIMRAQGLNNLCRKFARFVDHQQLPYVGGVKWLYLALLFHLR